MDKIEIKKISKGTITNYHYLDKDGEILELDKLKTKKIITENFYYKVENKTFDYKEDAEEYKKWLIDIRNKINYKKTNKKISEFLLLYQEQGWQVDYPTECFWCYIEEKIKENDLIEYLGKKHPIIKNRKFPVIKEKEWYYISFIDWDDGDYDNYKESWDLTILNQKEISEKIKNITDNFPFQIGI